MGEFVSRRIKVVDNDRNISGYAILQSRVVSPTIPSEEQNPNWNILFFRVGFTAPQFSISGGVGHTTTSSVVCLIHTEPRRNDERFCKYFVDPQYCGYHGVVEQKA